MGSRPTNPFIIVRDYEIYNRIIVYSSCNCGARCLSIYTEIERIESRFNWRRCNIVLFGLLSSLPCLFALFITPHQCATLSSDRLPRVLCRFIIADSSFPFSSITPTNYLLPLLPYFIVDRPPFTHVPIPIRRESHAFYRIENLRVAFYREKLLRRTWWNDIPHWNLNWNDKL